MEQPHPGGYQLANQAVVGSQTTGTACGGVLVHAVKENECAGAAQAVELAGKHSHPLMIEEGVQ